MEAKPGKTPYLFNVDIMLEAETAGEAMEQLLHLLNQAKPKDYRIVKGVQLGNAIEATEAKAVQKTPVPTAHKAAPPAGEPGDILKRLNECMAANTLIRLTVLKGKGVKLSLPCRIVGYDHSAQTVTVYHVDEKKVYQFRLSEIDDFIS